VKPAAVLILALVSIGCRTVAPVPGPLDPGGLAACIPADASALAGLDLAMLRRSPLAPKLGATFGGAEYALIAARPREIVSITSCAGAARTPLSPLIAEARPLAARNPVWAVIRGGSDLPLEGNLANVNTLLSDASVVRLTARDGDGIAIELTAECPADRAAHFENSLRALLLLGKMASAVQLRREGSTVRASFVAPADALAGFLH
jgi:hypothetical protein